MVNYTRVIEMQIIDQVYFFMIINLYVFNGGRIDDLAQTTIGMYRQRPVECRSAVKSPVKDKIVLTQNASIFQYRDTGNMQIKVGYSVYVNKFPNFCKVLYAIFIHVKGSVKYKG